MEENNEKYVSIITYEQQKQMDTMFPSPGKFVAKSSQIAIEQLKGNVSEIVNNITELLEELPERSTNFQIDEMSFSLSINASGKISLIGELSAGMNSGITLTFKRKL